MVASIVWNADPILFRLGPIKIGWYSLMWGIGFILAYEIVSRILLKENNPKDWPDKLFLYCLVFTVVGSRLGHCLFYEWDFYTSHPLEILKIWKGGLASHGGVFGLILGMVIFSVRVTHKNVWWLFDRMIPGVAALCFCIRFGNLMNSEIYGFPTTMPWGFEFVRSREWHQLYEGLPCHPTQIYEMIYCLVAGLTAWIMYRKYRLQRYVGLITGVSLLIFFGARFGLEFLKNPQVEEEVTMALNIGQQLSIPLILWGLYLIATCRKRKDSWMVL